MYCDVCFKQVIDCTYVECDSCGNAMCEMDADLPCTKCGEYSQDDNND